MSAALEDWQARLERHFAELHAQRRDKPLFALEHGLSQPELETLGSAVRAHVTFLGVLIAAKELGVRLRPELKAGETFQDEAVVEEAVRTGAIARDTRTNSSTTCWIATSVRAFCALSSTARRRRSHPSGWTDRPSCSSRIYSAKASTA